MWKQIIFSDEGYFFFRSNMNANEKILESAMNKALDWINSNNINEFKISQSLMSYSGSSIQASVTVVYKE